MFLDIEILRDLLKELGGNITFDSPCVVKMTPHSHPLKMRGLKFDDDNHTMIATGDLNIEMDTPNELSNTLLQRLKLIRYEKLKIKQ